MPHAIAHALVWRDMWCVTFPAGPWHTNCYLVAAREGTPDERVPCVIIDPGVGAAEPVRKLLDEHHLEAVGVLATHGHIDHVYTAEELSRDLDIPVWIHPDDEHLLSDPLAGLGADAEPLLQSFHGSTELTPPSDVRHIAPGTDIELAGFTFTTRHAPGHTRGSILFSLDAAQTGQVPVTFTGDVVFAGSIGRTDLPGGDTDTLMASLRDQVLTLPSDSALLPGHGPATTLAQEKSQNPWLTDIR